MPSDKTSLKTTGAATSLFFDGVFYLSSKNPFLKNIVQNSVTMQNPHILGIFNKNVANTKTTAHQRKYSTLNSFLTHLCFCFFFSRLLCLSKNMLKRVAMIFFCGNKILYQHMSCDILDVFFLFLRPITVVKV